jgi:hypothetical protein
MPRGFRALLPARIRLPYPRARRSGGDRCSPGFFASPERVPANRGTGFPAPSFLRFCRPISEETERPALQGLAESAGSTGPRGPARLS